MVATHWRVRNANSGCFWCNVESLVSWHAPFRLNSQSTLSQHGRLIIIPALAPPICLLQRTCLALDLRIMGATLGKVVVHETSNSMISGFMNRFLLHCQSGVDQFVPVFEFFRQGWFRGKVHIRADDDRSIIGLPDHLSKKPHLIKSKAL